MENKVKEVETNWILDEEQVITLKECAASMSSKHYQEIVEFKSDLVNAHHCAKQLEKHIEHSKVGVSEREKQCRKQIKEWRQQFKCWNRN